MRKGSLQVWMFVARLAGFILGGGAGLLLAGYGLSLALGGLADEQGLLLLYVGPVGFFIGGFVGMRMAGKRVRTSSHPDAERANGGTHD